MMFEDLWNHRLNSQKSRAQSLNAEIDKIDQKIEQSLDRVVATEYASVICAYEKMIKDLEAQKMELKEKIAFCGRPLKDYDETFRTALEFLSSPINYGVQRDWRTRERC